jgi:hypothetical protein
MPVRPASVALALLAAAALTGCRTSTVELGFRPARGTTYAYRYDVSADITSALGAADPVTKRQSSRLHAREQVTSVVGDEIRVDVTLSRDGGAERTAQVRLDRTNQLAGIDQVEGLPVEALGLVSLSDLFPIASAAPPAGPLAPGARWEVDEQVEISGTTTRVLGVGRLDRLGVIDDEDVATVVTDITVPIDTTTDTGRGIAKVRGTQHTTSTASYDLDDGAVRALRATTTGEVRITIEAPPGITAPAVDGELTYEVKVVTRREG